jgi:hypothetical protein
VSWEYAPAFNVRVPKLTLPVVLHHRFAAAALGQSYLCYNYHHSALTLPVVSTPAKRPIPSLFYSLSQVSRRVGKFFERQDGLPLLVRLNLDRPFCPFVLFFFFFFHERFNLLRH